MKRKCSESENDKQNRFKKTRENAEVRRRNAKQIQHFQLLPPLNTCLNTSKKLQKEHYCEHRSR